MDAKSMYCRTERKPCRGRVRLLSCVGWERQGGGEGVLSDAQSFCARGGILVLTLSGAGGSELRLERGEGVCEARGVSQDPAWAPHRASFGNLS